jgi:hypothetical protein
MAKPAWLLNFGAAPSIGQLAPASLGDLVMVENRLDTGLGSPEWNRYRGRNRDRFGRPHFPA